MTSRRVTFGASGLAVTPPAGRRVTSHRRTAQNVTSVDEAAEPAGLLPPGAAGPGRSRTRPVLSPVQDHARTRRDAGTQPDSRPAG
jgi:hypothetical protein